MWHEFIINNTTLVKRFGVSIEDEFLIELDRLVEKDRFPNRSQAIRYLIKKYSIENEWEDNSKVAGAIVLVYDLHKKKLQSKSTDVQHD
ncbi:MAG: ribbon-helix-helix protein, CopG family [Bacteroidales bacterium]